MLPRIHRLTKNNDFLLVYQRGRSLTTELLVLRFAKQEGDDLKIGFVVSKKIAKRAVKRNRVKRWLREAVRPFLPHLAPGNHLVFLARNGSEKSNFQTVRFQVEQLLIKGGLLKSKP